MQSIARQGIACHKGAPDAQRNPVSGALPPKKQGRKSVSERYGQAKGQEIRIGGEGTERNAVQNGRILKKGAHMFSGKRPYPSMKELPVCHGENTSYRKPGQIRANRGAMPAHGRQVPVA